MLGVGLNVGYAVSSNGKAAPIFSVTGISGYYIGGSAGHSRSFSNSPNPDGISGMSTSIGAGGSVGYVGASASKDDYYDAGYKKYSGGTLNYGANVGLPVNVYMDYSYTLVGRLLTVWR